MVTALLAGFRPLRVVLQINPPRELAEDLREAVRRLTLAGIPVLDQSVLLKGVNDDPAVMKELMQRLLMARVRPYYIYMADQVAGALARARLAQSQRRLITAIEQTAEGVLITDTQGVILYVNPAFERITAQASTPISRSVASTPTSVPTKTSGLPSTVTCCLCVR